MADQYTRQKRTEYNPALTIQGTDMHTFGMCVYDGAAAGRGAPAEGH